MITTNNPYGYLLHDRERRYTERDPIRVAERCLVFSDMNLLVPATTRRVNELQLFQGNTVQEETSAITWIKSKRGIKCAQAGGFWPNTILGSFIEKTQI